MSRQPRVFELDPETEPGTSDAGSSGDRRPRALDIPKGFVPIDDVVAQRTGDGEIEALQPPPPVARRRFSFVRLLLVSLGILLSVAAGLALDELIRELFERARWLGWVATGVAGLVGLALLGIVVRELAGLRRLARIEHLRQATVEAAASRDPRVARHTLSAVSELYAGRADVATGRAKLDATRDQIIDAPDLVRFGERALLHPLDARARRMVADAAKRVSVVTAVSPKAFVDVAFVLLENLRLVRRLADLYGGRPGTIGFWRLAKDVIAHLAVTGSIAVGDSVLQQVVGHGVAARLSARLGEGVVNGLLTARVGIAAMDVCRPMPFIAEARPGIREFVADLTRGHHNLAASAKETEGPGGR